MRFGVNRLGVAALGLAMLLGSGAAFGEQGKKAGSTAKANPPIVGTADQHPLRLASFGGPEKPTTASEKTTIKTTEKSVSGSDYREISSFFNIREANANVGQGQWELEVDSAWETGSGGDDDVSLGTSLKYGFSDDTYLELEVIPINLGDGGDQGAGELELTLFHQCTSESDAAVAIATWASMRIPSGDGSEGVDGTLNSAITKSLGGNWRVHLNGYVKTANGAMGDSDDRNRRDFQWGIGPGIDYQCDESTIGTINYINRSADQDGQSNDGIVEVGFAHKLADNQHLKFAVDVDVRGTDDDAANVGAKLQWSYEW